MKYTLHFMQILLKVQSLLIFKWIILDNTSTKINVRAEEVKKSIFVPLFCNSDLHKIASHQFALSEMNAWCLAYVRLISKAKRDKRWNEIFFIVSFARTGSLYHTHNHLQWGSITATLGLLPSLHHKSGFTFLSFHFQIGY